MEEVFVDTGALIALVSEEDKYHRQSLEIFTRFARENQKLFTSSFVIDELISWMRCKKKMDTDGIINFIKGLFIGDIEIAEIDEEIFGNSLRILKNFHDHYFSFTDCTSFTIMKMKKIKKVLSTDKHFTIAGFENLIEV